MLEIELDTKMYDWAVDFPWGKSFEAPYNDVYNKRTFNYVSDVTKAMKMQKKQIGKMIDSVKELAD